LKESVEQDSTVILFLSSKNLQKKWKLNTGCIQSSPLSVVKRTDVMGCYWSAGWFCPVYNFVQGNWSRAMYRNSLH